MTEKTETRYNTPRWRNLRRRIFERDGYRCRACGKPGKLECDHIKPVRRGGDFWDPANLATMCRGCHVEKTRRETSRRRTPPDVQEWRDWMEAQALKAKPGTGTGNG